MIGICVICGNAIPPHFKPAAKTCSNECNAARRKLYLQAYSKNHREDYQKRDRNRYNDLKNTNPEYLIEKGKTDHARATADPDHASKRRTQKASFKRKKAHDELLQIGTKLRSIKNEEK